MKKKGIILLIVIVMLIAIVPINVYAAKYQGMDTNIDIGGTSAINSSKSITSRMLGTVQVVGSIISIIALIIIGIRYMISSVEEKANLKGVLIYYIIGAVLVFATSNILSIVYNVFNSL